MDQTSINLVMQFFESNSDQIKFSVNKLTLLSSLIKHFATKKKIKPILLGDKFIFFNQSSLEYFYDGTKTLEEISNGQQDLNLLLLRNDEYDYHFKKDNNFDEIKAQFTIHNENDKKLTNLMVELDKNITLGELIEYFVQEKKLISFPANDETYTFQNDETNIDHKDMTLTLLQISNGKNEIRLTLTKDKKKMIIINHLNSQPQAPQYQARQNQAPQLQANIPSISDSQSNIRTINITLKDGAQIKSFQLETKPNQRLPDVVQIIYKQLGTDSNSVDLKIAIKINGQEQQIAPNHQKWNMTLDQLNVSDLIVYKTHLGG